MTPRDIRSFIYTPNPFDRTYSFAKVYKDRALNIRSLLEDPTIQMSLETRADLELHLRGAERICRKLLNKPLAKRMEDELNRRKIDVSMN